MGAPNVNYVLRVPGRLAYGCTDLSLVWPHGGTGMGQTDEIRLVLSQEDYEVETEGLGFEVTEVLQGAARTEIAFDLRSWDSDALSKAFPNTTAGTVTQHRYVADPGSNRAGSKGSASGIVLVFTPEGCVHAKSASVPDAPHPFVVLYRAVPLWKGPIEVLMRRSEDLSIPLRFLGIRDASARTRKWGRRADISL